MDWGIDFAIWFWGFGIAGFDVGLFGGVVVVGLVLVLG